MNDRLIPNSSPVIIRRPSSASLPEPVPAATRGPATPGPAPCGGVPSGVPSGAPSGLPRPRRRLVTFPVPPRGQRGFSLLELLVVVAILGILVAAALPRFAEFRAAAYDSRSQQDLRNLVAAEELFRATSPAYASDTALLTGFAASEGVTVAVESADETAFVATASHPAGSRDYRWDSASDPALTSTVR